MELNLPPPNIKPIQKNNTHIVKTEYDSNSFYLVKNSKAYMFENFNTQCSLKELKIQIDIAYGHCICTGLGFLLRENYLINKPEVTKITVIEKNKDVIDIQNELNPEIMSKLNIIQDNANLYKGECDCLLLDHFEDDARPQEIMAFSKLCYTNIKHKVLFWWDLISHFNYGLYNSKIKDMFNTLPDLTEEEYNNYIYIRK